MDKMISVVIPVYNVEKYIRQCLDSVVNQTYKNLQIVLVDDGSTDNSGRICDEYSEKDDRITVIHQKNAGAGAAKNTGLDVIKGEYFSIIDSDDYIELNMYEKMISLMDKYSVDIVQCNFNNVYVNTKHISKNNDKNIILLSVKEFSIGLLSDYRYSLFWNKLFKTTLLDEVRFPVGRKIDDEFFTYKLILNSNKILVINDALCNYRQRESSIMNENKQDVLINDRIDCFVERYKYIKENNTKLEKCFYEHLSDILLLYKGQAQSKELKKKIDSLISVYPYHKPGVVKRLFNRRRTPITENKRENLIFFD